jgi:hypothetical protein
MAGSLAAARFFVWHVRATTLKKRESVCRFMGLT